MKLIDVSLLIAVLLGCTTLAADEHMGTTQDRSGSIQPWSENPHYWEYKGNPVLLLGAFDHGHNPFIDGSTRDTVSVDDIDVIVNQIAEMVDAGGNVLRCVLDPGAGARLGIHSFKKDNTGTFDLNMPQGEYWQRLSTFITEAEKRDVIVELEIWDRFDWFGKNWQACPFNPKNNINYTYENTNLKPSYERGEIYLNHPMAIGVPHHPNYDSVSVDIKEKYDRVREFQEIFVSQVYRVTKSHGNVLYNMNNETSEHPAWGEYWIKHLKQRADEDDIKIICTNMQDGIFDLEESEELQRQFNHPELYDYLDISQINSRLRDEAHWHAVEWIATRAHQKDFLLYMTKLYGSDAREPDPWASWKPGDTDNAIEEWWRNLIAGVAGVRFHRPTSGIGLSDKAKACIRATRKIESKIKFWDVKPRQDLLTDRDEDEAYLAADPGKHYILYFTHKGAGSIGLNLERFDKKFDIHWLNIDTGNWNDSATINGGGIVTLSRPDDTAHWAAALVAQDGGQ